MNALARWLALVLLALAGLQLFFVLRIALMAWVDPQSTSFQRSEAWALWHSQGHVPWRKEWRPYAEISDHLKRAVLAAEDDGFTQHEGVQWQAIEQARLRNERALERANDKRPAKLRGGSTVTQQLAKNLLLSGERTLLRKGQELVLAYALEHLLDKRRILEIYLNNVEWGQGVFGAEAAARHYFGTSAKQLSAAQAARLAVMLPAPKRFEKAPQSAYLTARARAIQGRMAATQLP